MNPKEECERLLNYLTPIADRLLSEHGEFYPYAGVLEKSGEVRQIAASDGTEHPKSKPMIDHLINRIHNLAKKGDILASAIVYNGVVLLPDSQTKSDAIVIDLEHVSNYSARAITPYSKNMEGKISYMPMSVNPGTNQIF